MSEERRRSSLAAKITADNIASISDILRNLIQIDAEERVGMEKV